MEIIIGETNTTISIDIIRKERPEDILTDSGNWLDAIITVRAGAFKGAYRTNLRSDEFAVFYNDLLDLKSGNSNYIDFHTMEEGIELAAKLDMTGKILWKVEVRPGYSDIELKFSFETDNMSIDRLIDDVEELLKMYPVVGKRP